MPKFQVYKDAAGKCRFRLRADNNKIVAIGEAYEQHAGCLNGVKSIQKICNVHVEDTTIEGFEKLTNPKYQVYKDAAGEFRFRLIARNGEMVADSEGYESKEGCLNGIEVVGQSCNAEIEDTTTTMSPTAETEAPETIAATEPGVIALDQEKENEMLEELKKIRAALEKAPPPAPVPPKGLWNEFKDFLSKYKVFGLAVAFILGLYLGGLIQALVKDLLLPAIGLLIPGMNNLATYTAGPFTIGDFLVALITFIIVAFVIFIVVKVVRKWGLE